MMSPDRVQKYENMALVPHKPLANGGIERLMKLKKAKEHAERRRYYRSRERKRFSEDDHVDEAKLGREGAH